MQGVLIASADVAVRRSLHAIVGQGRTVHECATIAEALALAGVQRMDYVFVDDLFKDGTALQLVSRLHRLGYGAEIIPVVVSDERVYIEPFQAQGVRHWIVKPFDVDHVLTVTEEVERLLDTTGPREPFASEEPPASVAAAAVAEPASDAWESSREIDIREVSQRFRRLLASSLKRAELVAAFAEGVQEQFDVDNVVVLLPAVDAPCFRIACGHIDDEVRQQFFIPFGEPLVSALVRLGEPVWVDDGDALPAACVTTAVRYGERLGIRLLCPVVARTRVLALVGLSRTHRYGNSPFLFSLLRLFLTFFAKALENAEFHGQLSKAEQTYRGIFDVFPAGAVAVSAEGTIRHVNPLAAGNLGASAEALEGQPVERAGSLFADAVRETLATGAVAGPRRIGGGQREFQISALPVGEGAAGGVLVMLQEPTPAAPGQAERPAAAYADEILRDMAQALAHNFKNALVPIKTCAELLPQRHGNEAFRQSFFEVVQENIEKIDGWIDALLRFGELQNGEGRRSSFPLHEAVDAGFEQASSLPRALKAQVRRDYADDDVVFADRQALEQAFAEVTRNAFDALQDVPAPGLTLSTRGDGETVEAEIVDNGSGLDMAVKADVFKPFVTRKLSGLGLGLTYVQRVTELHGGTLDIQPAAGQGTCVRLSFPAASKPSPVAT